MSGSYIVAGARTPIGKMSGALSSFSAADLGGFAIKAALERALAAEKKEREELELRIQRAGKSIENGDRLELEVKAFNVELAAKE